MNRILQSAEGAVAHPVDCGAILWTGLILTSSVLVMSTLIYRANPLL
jgi:hypothetical protein